MRHLATTLITVAAMLHGAAPQALAQTGAWALVNARIETVTRGTIQRGTIVIRDGILESVGANITPPADARVVDFSGRTIYPGFIDLTSSLGTIGSSSARPAGAPPEGGAGAAASAGNVGLEPGRLIANELRLTESEVRSSRDAGITAVLIAPTRGAFRGLSALVPLRDDTATRWIVRSPVALHMGFQTVPGRYPGSLLGVIAYERQAFYDAQRHAAVLDRYKTQPTGMPRASYDANLDALVPVVRGELPVFFAASNENEMRRAHAIGQEFGLKLSIVGASEAFRLPEILKDARLSVLSVDFPDPATVTGWQYRGAQRVISDDSATRASSVRSLLEANAAALNTAGARFALASGGLRASEFLANVRKAIAAGLPRQVALEALTIRAAEAAGAEKQLGSIESGKIANLVVMEGEALTESARVRVVFVDGQRYDVIPPNGRAAGAPRGGSRLPENHP